MDCSITIKDAICKRKIIPETRTARLMLSLCVCIYIYTHTQMLLVEYSNKQDFGLNTSRLTSAHRSRNKHTRSVCVFQRVEKTANKILTF